MKKITVLLIALLIASIGIVAAKISGNKRVEIRQEEAPKPILLEGTADVTSWD